MSDRNVTISCKLIGREAHCDTLTLSPRNDDR